MFSHSHTTYALKMTVYRNRLAIWGKIFYTKRVR